MCLPQALLGPTAFVLAAALATLGASLAATVVENRSAAAVASELMADGITWATAASDGLQVTLTGTAPTEAARFRAVSLAGRVIDANRVRDELDVTPVQAIEAPRFSVEMLRNGDGIQLIGLLPETEGQPTLAGEAAALASGMKVTDLLETAAFPAPEGWDDALSYGLAALKMLPRSKISVAADRVAVTAIADSEAEKSMLERDLKAARPQGLAVAIDILAPRPVLTPFTLRFVKDAEGARFDACAADSTRARDRILAAAATAGLASPVPCTVGLGVPSPTWGEAAEAGIRAVAALGDAQLTFSDADVTLLAGPDVPQATFDTVVGELQTAMPRTFSLQATLAPKPVAVAEGPAEFTATLAEDGQVQLRGRLTDELLRGAVDSFARAQFGASSVYTATRLDAELPDGWAVRVLAGLESLGQLANGRLLVRADTVEVAGVTGSQGARARIAQVLSDRLGQGQTFRVSVTYDEALDPLAALPTPAECMAGIDAALSRQKIVFAPGSAEIDAAANPTLDAIAEMLAGCPPLTLEIAGHTDAQGSAQGNRALSQARAEAVLLSLQGRRAPVDAITAVGYGEDRPIAENDGDAGREANRRIEFILKDADGQVVPPTATATAPMPAIIAGAPPGGDAAATDAPSVAPAKADLRPKKRADDQP